MNNTNTHFLRQLRTPLLCVVLMFSFTISASAQQKLDAAQKPGSELVDRYIQAWADFYPSAAFAYGDVNSAASFENFSEPTPSRWLTYNKKTALHAQKLLDSNTLNPSFRVDLQVLLAQTQDELATWQEDLPLTNQPQRYAEQVSQALTSLLVRDQLSIEDRSAALVARLIGVQQLCALGIEQLNGGNALRIKQALSTLSGTREFYAGGLKKLTASWPGVANTLSFDKVIAQTVDAVENLENHINKALLPGAESSAAIGVGHYTAKLSRRTSGLYSPVSLLREAGHEMSAVRALMVEQAQRWQATLPKADAINGTPDEILSAAIAAMEKDRQHNKADFLESFRSLTEQAGQFVEEHKLATVPKPATLTIALSPAHFSGAAVGGVYPTGPFAPQSDTIFYVPSIPDSAPSKAKEGFYRSFNTHFNTMIMSHEMYPGHYLQYKVAVTQAPALRSLFANGSYVEGWGSFSEELMLDAGWADNAPLTRLAHLRKRLENATRAYVSVKVNIDKWDEAKVIAFARDEGLLAPQFAKNLWQRVVNSPMQITDYFTGYQHFKRLFDEYTTHSPDAEITPWVDAVLQQGPVPLVILGDLL